jgi:hypothetical protein
MALKGNREVVWLISKGLKKNGKQTNYAKTTTKNKKGEKKGIKLKRRCFDPRAWNEKLGRCGLHVEFEEGKAQK